MRLRRPAGPVVATLLVAGLAAGCGSAKAGPTVDQAGLAKQISTGLAGRYKIPAPVVHCPGGESNTPGKTFSCSTAVDGQSLGINAQVHKPNDINWQPAASVVSTALTQKALQDRFAPQLGTFTVTCGGHALQVVAVNASFMCTGTVKGQVRTFTVTASNLAGDVELDLEPPTTGPGSTTPVVTAPPTPGSTPGAGTLPGD